MFNDFQEYLEAELEEAVAEFEKAKAAVIDEVKAMNFRTAVDSGAAYASKIDRISLAAAKIQTLSNTLRAYKYDKSQES